MEQLTNNNQVQPKSKYSISYCFKNFAKVLKDVFVYIINHKIGVSFKIILELLLLVLLLFIVHAPFGLVYNLIVMNMRNVTTIKIIYYIKNVIYVIFAIVVFVRIFVERYEKLPKGNINVIKKD